MTIDFEFQSFCVIGIRVKEINYASIFFNVDVRQP